MGLKEIQELKNNKGKPKEKKIYRIPKVSEKKKAILEEERKDNTDTELQMWFKYQMGRNKKVCQNCGVSLSHYDLKSWHGSQHHILEKSLFPSVKCEMENNLVLGMWCCHSQWHTSWSNASKMPVFKLAKEKFNLFKDRISPDEKRKIPDVLLATLEYNT